MPPESSDTSPLRTESNQRWLFGTFFVAGSASILILKTFVNIPLIATAIPCALLLAYASMLWDSKSGRLRFDSAGDNLYYLGFLYTLTSLAHALQSFASAAAGQEGAADLIVTNFGIAISTTILGMALRVLLGRPDDAAATEQSTRLTLVQTSLRLRAEMDYALDDVRHFRESASATLQDGLDEARDTIVARTRALDRAVMDLEDSVRTTTNGLATSASQITDHANTAKSSLERHSALIDRETASLATDVHSVHKALRSQIDTLRNLDFRQAFVEHTITPTVTELRTTIADLTALIAQLTDDETTRTRAIAAFTEVTNKLDESLEANRIVISQAVAAGEIANATAIHLQSLQEAVAEFAAATHSATATVNSTQHEFQQSESRMRDLNRSVADVAGALEKTTRGIDHTAKVDHNRWFIRIGRLFGQRS